MERKIYVAPQARIEAVVEAVVIADSDVDGKSMAFGENADEETVVESKQANESINEWNSTLW